MYSGLKLLGLLAFLLAAVGCGSDEKPVSEIGSIDPVIGAYFDTENQIFRLCRDNNHLDARERAELIRPLQEDLFNVDFSSCPDDFRSAWLDVLAAIRLTLQEQDRIINDPDPDLDAYSREFSSAMRRLKEVAQSYGITHYDNDFMMSMYPAGVNWLEYDFEKEE